MKKIGILTYSKGANYGGTLQCLALYKTIQKISNSELEVINYNGHYNFISKYLANTGLSRNIKKNLRNIVTITHNIFFKMLYVDNILKKFNEFRKKELKMTRSVSKEDIKKNILEFTDIIVGSDQVWSVYLGKNGYNPFFLEDIKGINKFSYAACSGRNLFKKEDEESLKKALNDFDEISVRNLHTFNFVKDLTGKKSKIVADPTILYDFKEYLNNIIIEEKYIITYILGDEINGGHEKVIKEIKQKYKNMKIIAIGLPLGNEGIRKYSWADKVFYDLKPEKWLNLINQAEFVYTDSYHGVLFSLKFHKNFLAYYSMDVRAPRFIDLAERYQIGDWIVNSVEDFQKKDCLNKKIDYKKVDKLLENHRKYSINFLKNILGEN